MPVYYGLTVSMIGIIIIEEKCVYNPTQVGFSYCHTTEVTYDGLLSLMNK